MESENRSIMWIHDVIKEGEYEVAGDTYIVEYFNSTVKIFKGGEYVRQDWVTLDDTFQSEFVFDTGTRIRDLETPLYYLFYLTDVALSIHEYETGTGMDQENYWTELEETPEILADMEQQRCDFVSDIEKEAREKWEPILII